MPKKHPLSIPMKESGFGHSNTPEVPDGRNRPLPRPSKAR